MQFLRARIGGSGPLEWLATRVIGGEPRRISCRRPIVDAVCAAACALALLHWDILAGGVWELRHKWLFASRSTLADEVAWINALAGFSIYFILRAVFAPMAAAGIAVTMGMCLAAASERKMRLLDMPILPWDLWFLGNLTSFGEFLGFSKLTLGLAVASVAPMVLVLWRLRRHLLRTRGHAVAVLAAVATCALWTFLVIVPSSPRFLSGQIHNITWDLGANYTNFGPYYPFIVNLKYITIPAPSRKAFDAAEAFDRQRALLATVSHEPADVVVILSESFTALPVQIFGVPFTCLASAPLSKLITPAWGGLTANVESEVLTGYPHALFPVGAVPYQMYIKRPMAQALPRVFRDSGYRTTATHTFLRSFFSRPMAYEMMGFDDYVGLEDLKQAPKRGQYVDDQVIFDELLRQLDVPGTGPRFVHAVTMMAHLPYDWPGRYPVDPRLDSRLPADLQRHKLSLTQYASMIYDHEAMFCRFIEKLKTRPRRTLVLFYGDHYPSFGSMDVYRDIHASLHGNEPLDLLAGYSKTPIALFDSRRGFVPLPSEVPGYNVGTLLLREAGIAAPGIWAMPHKVENVAIKRSLFVASHQAAISLSPDAALGSHPELEVLRAHSYRVLFGGEP